MNIENITSCTTVAAYKQKYSYRGTKGPVLKLRLRIILHSGKMTNNEKALDREDEKEKKITGYNGER
jgi:hypothetical protein